jgi:hypothetical protein
MCRRTHQQPPDTGGAECCAPHDAGCTAESLEPPSRRRISPCKKGSKDLVRVRCRGRCGVAETGAIWDSGNAGLCKTPPGASATFSREAGRGESRKESDSAGGTKHVGVDQRGSGRRRGQPASILHQPKSPPPCSPIYFLQHSPIISILCVLGAHGQCRACHVYTSAGHSGRTCSLSSIRVFFVMLLCALACAGVGGAEDDRVGGMENDTDRTIHMKVSHFEYPRMINSGRSGRQTVDDLVFNHFLIHSLGGGGWWRGPSTTGGSSARGSSARGSSARGSHAVGSNAPGTKANKPTDAAGSEGGFGNGDGAELGGGVSTLRGEDLDCSLHHVTIRAANFDHNQSFTQTCARKVAWRLWRSRYLLGDEVMQEEDGEISVRLAKDYQPEEGQLPGALRLIKFLRHRHSFEQHWLRLQQLWLLFPDVMVRPVEALQASHDPLQDPQDPVLDPARPFIIVLEGGLPLSHLIALHDQVRRCLGTNRMRVQE